MRRAPLLHVKPLDLDAQPTSRRAVLVDLAWLLGLGLVVLGAGLGLRDPWPADEPRFALVARDMVASGEWLFPRVGGDWYQDKPPLFFWTIALFLAITGSLRVAFLLPSLLAALGTLALIYDLGRRLWDRNTGFAAAFALLFTVQFSLQAHLAQIDALLCFWTTLALYAFCRHLLLGHGWKWYALGGFVAGIGVITKGVGFLPFLVLIPFAIARWRRWPLPRIEQGGWRWAIAPATFLLAIALWLVPMLTAVALSDDPQLAAYRDEILFQQTVKRYAGAWHHNKPFYYYLTVMLSLWLPLILLLPWLAGRWRERFRARDTRLLLLLGWAVLVLLFFSTSPGKRGVYILPALPAFALSAGPWLRGLAQRRDVQRTLFGLGLALVILCALAFVYFEWVDPQKASAIASRAGVATWLPLAMIAAFGAIGLRIYGLERAPQAWAAVLGIIWLVGGWWLMPQINDARSARGFVAQLDKVAASERELGLLAYKEQFLLYLQRPTVNFGHARWREGPQEAYDAAFWLNGAPTRQLLVDQTRLDPCFANVEVRVEVGETSGENWWLVSGKPDARCVAQGQASAARSYTPP
jgi:4-amino-4-deoxy-L-arabinose transferase-like glycosyltransferase